MISAGCLGPEHTVSCGQSWIYDGGGQAGARWAAIAGGLWRPGQVDQRQKPSNLRRRGPGRAARQSSGAAAVRPV